MNPLFVQKSVAQFTDSCSNLAAHISSSIAVSKLLTHDDIQLRSQSGDSIEQAQADAVTSNILANCIAEKSAADLLLSQLKDAFKVLRGSLDGNVALAANPSSIVALALQIREAGSTLDLLDSDDAGPESRKVDRVSMMAEIQEQVKKMQDVSNTLGALKESLMNKSFADLPGGQSAALQRQTDASVSRIITRSADSGIARLSFSMYGG